MNYSTCLLCDTMVSGYEKLCLDHEKEFPQFQDKDWWRRYRDDRERLAEEIKILDVKHPLVTLIVETITAEAFYQGLGDPRLISVNTTSAKVALVNKLIEYFRIKEK